MPPTGLIEPANKTNDMKYRVWLKETAYYVIRLEAESEKDAIAQAEASALPKPYDFGPVVTTKIDLVPVPRSSKYKPARRRWYH